MTIKAAVLATSVAMAELCADRASAQPPEHTKLRIPTVAVSAAAAGDLASTYYGLNRLGIRESNPLLQRWQDSRRKLVWMAAAIDFGSISTWNIAVGRDHPRVAVSGLWVMTAFRTYLAIHNLRTTSGTPLKSRDAETAHAPPPHSD
jgi:hypothetical protein